MAYALPHLLLSSLFLLPFSAVAQTKGNVTIGASLTANDKSTPWLSTSEDFAFGFQQLQDKSLFLLCIWYHRVPDKNIVWYANEGNAVPRESKLVLANGGLVLSDSRGKELWNSGSTADEVAYGFMNDTGNFVLVRSDSVNIWESFKDPSDTMLPTQIMESGGVLFSRQTETNFSRGRFQFRLLLDGNLVLNTRDVLTNLAYDAYYISGTYDPSDSLNSGYQDGLLSGLSQKIYVSTLAGVEGSGACGYNSVCSLDDYRRPTCECPQGFSLLDPDDKYGHCKPSFSQSCDDDELSSAEDIYDFLELLDTDWPTSDYEQMKPYNEEGCRKSCLQDCFCAVAIFRGESCWKKKLPLSNGRKDTGVNGKALIKFRKAESNLRCFTYKELLEATNGFTEELGRGSFGIVYKGVIQMGSTNVVAVKKLDSLVRDTEKEFKTEVNVIGQTHHKNLVRLLGFCEEGRHKMLVYEFMSNGTLASFLFGDLRPSLNQRTEIALGIARGLLYLHEECGTQIIHCDIKPQNILLDDYYNARISDFGLAKLLMINQSHTSTATIRGTKGYFAPEWFRSTPITVKVDVYSFGVLLLEIICCRRSLENHEIGEGREILIDWVCNCFQAGRLGDLVENDMEALNDWRTVEKSLLVGIWCIQEDPSSRPTIRRVTQMLEGVVEVTMPPYPWLSSTTN
ncbi:hypothetical protein F0562_001390 [Nyssa sinensis]|uniref:non-specific serine/threonine protein kinase n=1 Tax=Nyssa sinensis TaxID=561372 RepID=A0A5J5C6K4_9ASTE|nr:hypothetical protein F0562_001390 [Nyssa sinensis]